MSALPHHHDEYAHELLHHMPPAEHFSLLAELFRQLGDGTRLRLFWLLCHTEQCVTNLSAMMQMSSPALSHHLRLLKDAGLVVSCRSGKEVYYSLDDDHVATIISIAIEHTKE